MINTDGIVDSLKAIKAKRSKVSKFVIAYMLMYSVLSILWIYYDLNDILGYLSLGPIIEVMFGHIWMFYPVIMLIIVIGFIALDHKPYKNPTIKLKYWMIVCNLFLWFYIIVSLIGQDASMPLKKCIYLLLLQHVSIALINLNIQIRDDYHLKDDMIKDYIRWYRQSDVALTDDDHKKYYSIVNRYIDKYL